MTCQECERKLGMSEDAGEHLASCAECRWLARELRLNSHALREMRVRPTMHWVLATAAAIVIAVSAWKMTRVEKLAMPAMQMAVAKPQPARLEPAPSKKAERHLRPAPEPLRVKMFTSDPDVVIYWIVDKKEGYE
jgi:hypothetical protein